MDRSPLRYINLTSDELDLERDKFKKLVNSTNKSQLLAQWMVIDGKLVCQWLSR